MKKEIVVKVCSRCGTANTERAEECESCGAELGAAVNNREAKKLSRQIARRNEQMKKAIAAEKFGGSGKAVPDIPLTPSRIIIGSVACLVALGVVVLGVLSMLHPNEYANALIAADFCALVLLVIAILHCFLPGEMWAIGHCLDQIYYKEMPQPSDTGLVLQQVSCVLLTMLGGAVFALHLLVLCGML